MAPLHQNRVQRAKSYFFSMRKFHNTIKRDLYNKYTKNIDNLLDLACGKAGDLDKWVTNNIKKVIGYDIDNNSIEEAKRRITQYNSKDTNIQVYVKDLSRNIIKGNNTFDVITSMFAFHYFFESKYTFETIMRSIENNLKDDGIFMGTMFDGNKMRDSIIENDSFELVDNENKQLRFKVKLLNENVPLDFFGNRISVYLKDTVLDEPMDEYLVYFEEFVRIMKDRNFELIESKMFEELYLHKDNLNNIEKKVSFLNRTFVFRKIKINICNVETPYLTSCKWEELYEQTEINESTKNIVLDMYKADLTDKINNSTTILRKDTYTFLRDNFEKLDYTKLQPIVAEYYKVIHKVYLDDMKKYYNLE